MNEPLVKGNLVDDLLDALQDAKYGLAGVPAAIKAVIAQQAWKERLIPKLNKVQRFERFEDFVTTPPLEGLGTDIAMLINICRDDVEARDAIERITLRGPGNPTGANQYSVAPDAGNGGNHNNIINSSKAVQGTSESYARRKLRKSRPDLLARVDAHELKATAAMREAGYRKPTVTVRTDSPESAARTLIGHMDADLRRELARLLLLAEAETEAEEASA
jgi:hypothetical protein